MMKFFKRLLGSDGKNDELLQEKRAEAHAIRNKMTSDIVRIKKKVDRINRNTYNKLKEVSADLETVTYHIAVATGGKRRGLK